jgi:hypothetical protein
MSVIKFQSPGSEVSVSVIRIPEFLPVSVVAEMLNKTTDTVINLANRNVFDVKRDGRKIMIGVKSVSEFVEGNRGRKVTKLFMMERMYRINNTQ